MICSAVLDLREIGFDEKRLHAFRLESGLHPLAVLSVAAGNDQPGDAAFGEKMRDGLAEPLRRAGDDGDLAFERKVVERGRVEHVMSLS